MRFFTIIVAGLACSASIATATTIARMSFLEIARASDGVIAGIVSDITARRSDQGIIFSFVTLEDVDVVQGSYEGDSFTLRLEGGSLDGEIQVVEGAPNFRVGERVLVFVDGNGERIVPIAGWEQGLFRVISDPESGEEFISDAVGNRVFGILEGELVKEDRFGTAAELYGGEQYGHAHSERAQINFGHAEGGEILPEEQPHTDESALQLEGLIGSVMTYEAFTTQLSTQLEAAGVSDFEPLVSVDVGEMPELSLRDAQPARTPSIDGPIELAPAERGEAPRPIDPGELPNPDSEEGRN